MNRKQILFIILALVLSSLACGKFYVYNNGPFPIAVKVTLPDGAYGTRRLEVAQNSSWNAFTSGSYTVEVLRDEEYVGQMQDIQLKAMDGIFADGPLTNELNPKGLVNLFSDVQWRLDELARMSTSACSGKIPDDPTHTSIYDIEYEPIDVTVSVNYDQETNHWSCGEKK